MSEEKAHQPIWAPRGPFPGSACVCVCVWLEKGLTKAEKEFSGVVVCVGVCVRVCDANKYTD